MSGGRRRGAFWELSESAQAYLQTHFPGATINAPAVRRDYLATNQIQLLITVADLPSPTRDKEWDIPERVIELAPPYPGRPSVKFHVEALAREDREQLLEIQQRILVASGRPTIDLSMRSITGVVRAYCKAAGISERQVWRMVRAVRRSHARSRRPGETDVQWAKRYRAMGYRPSKKAPLGWELARMPRYAWDWRNVLPGYVFHQIIHRAGDQRIYIPKRPIRH